MSRPTKEWIGRTDSTPAPARVKARIVMAQDGICACGCGVKLGAAGEGIDFDHTQALILGGENREGNLRALRRPCHGSKTKQDVKQKSVEALSNYQQADMDGIIVTVSRQAIEECLPVLRAIAALG